MTGQIQSGEQASTSPTAEKAEPLHLFDPESLEFATVNGLPARAFCGAWEASHSGLPSVYSDPDGEVADGRTCQACLDWWRSHWGPS